jgi:hypothetical protein
MREMKGAAGQGIEGNRAALIAQDAPTALLHSRAPINAGHVLRPRMMRAPDACKQRSTCRHSDKESMQFQDNNKLLLLSNTML